MKICIEGIPVIWSCYWYEALVKCLQTTINLLNNIFFSENVEHPMKVLSKNGDENATENVKESEYYANSNYE